jgi:uncharacterized protein (DUF885 family)
MKRSTILLFLTGTVVALLGGCGPQQKTDQAAAATQTTTAGSAAFGKLADAFLADYLAWRPQTGTYVGLHAYDGKVTDYRRASLDAELARLKEYRDRLARLDTASLNARNFYDYRILRSAVNQEIFRFEDLGTYTLQPMTYAGAFDVNIYAQRDFAPLPDRMRSIIAILQKAPQVMAAARQNLRDTLARPHVETAIQIARGSADFLAKDLPKALREVKDDSLQGAFRTASAGAIKELRGYADFLEKEKLPRANEAYAIGPANYRKMLLYNEMLTTTPEAILAMGLKKMKEEQAQFAAAARVIDPTKSPAQVYASIQKDHPTAANLIPGTRKNLESIRQYLVDHQIITIPSEVRVRVEETPPFARATSTASMDTPGPFEQKATQAFYYVTPVEPEWSAKQKEEWLSVFNYYTTDIISIHEAYPGHYVQFLKLNASPATRIEKVFGSYAFIEGWAHYTEQMMLEAGFGSDKDSVTLAKYKMAQLAESLLRLCRLAVSVQMHTQGMKLPAATKFFQDNCYYEYKPAQQEALRGTYDPGYLSYTLGKLQILDLREAYKKQEGDNYSLKKFHDTLLNHGMPPIQLIREIMLTKGDRM